MATTIKSERRRKSRKRPLTLVYVELASANGGMMRDLSEEGFAVRAMIPVKAGENTPFSFSLTEKIYIEGRGQITWVQENGHVAGVRFVELSQTMRQRIREWLVRPDEPPKRREDRQGTKEVSMEELREEIHSVPVRDERKHEEPGPSRKTTVAEPVAPVKPPEIPSAPPPQATASIEAAAKPAAPEREVVPTKEPEPVVTIAPEPVVPPVVEKEPTATASPVMAKEQESVVPPIAAAREPELPPGPVAVVPSPIETPPAASSPTDNTRAASVPVAAPAATVPSVAPPEKSPEPMIAPPSEPKRENHFEEPPAPALPRLKLFPAPVDASPPPATSEITAAEEPSLPQPVWKPIEPIDPPASLESESKVPESQQPALPDISTVLMRPSGEIVRPVLQQPPMEPVSASWEPAGESWTVRFSITKAVALMSIVALLVGLYVLHRNIGQGLIWLGVQMGGVAPMSVPLPANSTAPTTHPVQHSTPQTDTSNTGSPEPPSAKGSTGQGAAPAVGSGPDLGQSEYEHAMQLLRGKRTGGPADPEALRFLWIAVEKGNGNAELQLADMYWHGHGVMQNCDQAHILLTTAARKGGAEAQRRLQEFEKAGCGWVY
jgi:hypothetical protein